VGDGGGWWCGEAAPPELWAGMEGRQRKEKERVGCRRGIGGGDSGGRKSTRERLKETGHVLAVARNPSCDNRTLNN
jgi:hypothetical protein